MSASVAYSYADACRNIFNTIKTSGHSSFEKYTSHTSFSKGLRKGWYWLCVRGELETEQNCNILTLILLSITVFLVAQPGGWGPSLCWYMILIPASYLQLIWRGSWGPPLLGAGSLYSILSPTNSNILFTELLFYAHSIQPVDSQGYPLTQVHFLFWQLGRVEGQYTTPEALYHQSSSRPYSFVRGFVCFLPWLK